ncbi:MAG: FliG C-terminal domain-containing protein [Chloroflexota bacterium]
MSEPRRIGDRPGSFEDLVEASDELLRQLAARVHIIDLAYAFGTADERLRERLFQSVRPGLADQIRSAIKSIQAESARSPSEEQVRTARARVMELARATLQEE